MREVLQTVLVCVVFLAIGIGLAIGFVNEIAAIYILVSFTGVITWALLAAVFVAWIVIGFDQED